MKWLGLALVAMLVGCGTTKPPEPPPQRVVQIAPTVDLVSRPAQDATETVEAVGEAVGRVEATVEGQEATLAELADVVARLAATQPESEDADHAYDLAQLAKAEAQEARVELAKSRALVKDALRQLLEVSEQTEQLRGRLEIIDANRQHELDLRLDLASRLTDAQADAARLERQRDAARWRFRIAGLVGLGLLVALLKPWRWV